MNDIAVALNHILQDSETLLTTPLSLQQRPFAQHIRQTASVWLERMTPIPASEEALYQIIPAFGNALIQQIVALYGYAKLMLDYPTSFDHAPITDEQRAILTRIYQWGMAIAQRIDQLKVAVVEWRMMQRKQTPQQFNLSELLHDQLPIYRYWLEREFVQLNAQLNPQPNDVIARPYHISEFIHHVLITLAREGMAQQASRQLHLSLTHREAYNGIRIEANPLKNTDLDFLFVKDGRAMYIRQLERDGGQLEYELDATQARCSVSVWLPV